MAKTPWWKQGVNFECQGSGKCCISHGNFGFVFLTLKDRQKLAAHLGIETRKFTQQYCQKTNGYFHLTESPDQKECTFLKNRQCSVYAARPTQCRTWPFWPEVMPVKKWTAEVAGFCPGVGKGKLIDSRKIKATLDQQRQADRDY